jgi:hypothetical protein
MASKVAFKNGPHELKNIYHSGKKKLFFVENDASYGWLPWFKIFGVTKNIYD